MYCRRFGSLLLDDCDAGGDDFFNWRRIPRSTWSGCVVDADIVDCLSMKLQR